MPTIFNNIQGYRIYFVSYDCAEPMHVHVTYQDAICKFWLHKAVPELAWQKRFSQTKLNQIERIIVRNKETIINAWNETCK